MKTKAQELALRDIMQGLEEFATFMSYRSDYEGMRIISVETVREASERERHERATVLAFDDRRRRALH